MRRLLQLGLFLFTAVLFLAPLAECFDSWDPPGISNDSEFALFVLVFTLCLVLLVSKLISDLATRVSLIWLANYHQFAHAKAAEAGLSFTNFIPPLPSPPLRI
jgi:hypothetical protein